MKNPTITTLNKVVNVTDNTNYGRIHEIIECAGKKFKLCVAIENGSSDKEVAIMDSGGVFQFVLGRDDIDYQYTASYVSSAEKKMADLEKALSVMKEVIKKVYA